MNRGFIGLQRSHAASDVARLADELRHPSQREAVRVLDLQRASSDRRRVARRQRVLQALRHLRQRRLTRLHLIAVVDVTQVDGPLVPGRNRTIQEHADAGEVALGVSAPCQGAQRRRIQHRRRNLELEDVEAAVARALDAGVRRLEIDTAAEMLIPHQQIIEREELVARLDVLCRVVIRLRLGNRFRREDEAIDQMTLHGDLELIVHSRRHATEGQPVAHLDIVSAGRGEGVLEEIIQPRRAATRALQERIRDTRPLGDHAAICVVDLQAASPKNRIARVVAVIHIEGGGHRVADIREQR